MLCVHHFDISRSGFFFFLRRLMWNIEQWLTWFVMTSSSMIQPGRAVDCWLTMLNTSPTNFWTWHNMIIRMQKHWFCESMLWLKWFPNVCELFWQYYSAFWLVLHQIWHTIPYKLVPKIYFNSNRGKRWHIILIITSHLCVGVRVLVHSQMFLDLTIHRGAFWHRPQLDTDEGSYHLMPQSRHWHYCSTFLKGTKHSWTVN